MLRRRLGWRRTRSAPTIYPSSLSVYRSRGGWRVWHGIPTGGDRPQSLQNLLGWRWVEQAEFGEEVVVVGVASLELDELVVDAVGDRL